MKIDRPWAKGLSGMLIQGVGLILSTLLISYLARDASLWVLGQRVKAEVVYLPFYPAHNRLAESRLVPLLACAYVPLALLSLGLLALGRRLMRLAQARLEQPSFQEVLR